MHVEQELKTLQRSHDAGQLQMEALRTATNLAIQERDQYMQEKDSLVIQFRNARIAYVL